jgi:beta-lactamase class C
VAYHGGYVHGYKAEIAFCKQDDIGIVFLTNSPNSTASKSVPGFLDLLFEYNDNKRILTDAADEKPDINPERG